MTQHPGLFGRVFEIIGSRWWLSVPTAALCFVYPVYYFLNWSDESYSRSGFKLVVALILLGGAMLYMTYLSLTVGPPPKIDKHGT